MDIRENVKNSLFMTQTPKGSHSHPPHPIPLQDNGLVFISALLL